MANPPIGRTFLVGCPRSGTSLLQSLLFAHPDVVSFPETFFFHNVVPRGPRRRALRLASPLAPKALDDLERLGLPVPRTALPPLTVAQYARRFCRALDSAARESGASMWIEKTPDHHRYVSEIERHVPGARFIHLVRDGEAVVASLHDVSVKFPDVWGADHTIAELTEKWSAAIRNSHACVGRPRHAFVSYERLMDDGDAVLRGLCSFLDLPADDDRIERMKSSYAEKSRAVVGIAANGGSLAPEPWKAGLGQKLENRNGDKLEKLFDARERDEIRRAVARQQPLLRELPFL